MTGPQQETNSFDEYIRAVSTLALVFFAIGFVAQVAAGLCDAFWLSLFYMFIQAPLLACTLVVPFIWGLIKERPIERNTVLLAAAAVITTAAEVAFPLLARGPNCFR